MLFGGAAELLLVGWATSRPITNLPLMVFDQSHSAASRAIITALENTGTFQAPQQVTGMGAIQAAMERGQINAALIIPPDFSQQMLSPSGHPALSVILNGAENTPALAAQRAVQGLASAIDQRIVIQRLGLSPGQFAGFAPSLRVWFNENLSEALYTTPAELGLMLEFTVLLFAALAFSRERELGTLEQLLVMPFSSLEIIIGKAIPVILVGFADFLLMLAMVHFAFGVPVRGSLPLLMLLAFVYLLVELGKGMVHLGHLAYPASGLPAGVAGRHGGLHVHRLRRPGGGYAPGAAILRQPRPRPSLADHPARHPAQGRRAWTCSGRTCWPCSPWGW